jgi:hypothetical protein
MRIYWFILFVLGLLLLLHWQFPAAADGFGERMRIVYLLAFLAIITGGGWFRRISAGKAVQYGGIWLAIILALVLFYEVMRRITM